MKKTMMILRFTKLTFMICLALFGPVAISVVQAQPQSASSQTDVPTDVGIFLNDFFAEQLADLAIPGAAIAIVQENNLLYAKGYGVANLAEATPVSADETVFRIASVSKLIVATAIMQLVEAGKLDLHTDVNTYLTRFQLDATYADPVTLHHLLTHTGGFDNLYVGSVTLDESQRMSLGDYLAERMPPRVMPPGDVTSYSNHGFALAAFVAEEVTGMPFWQHVEDNIQEPLAMTHSGYLLSTDPSANLAGNLAGNLAVGYTYEQGKPKALPYDYFHRYPPSSFMATATDMAHFITAQLNEGRFEDGTILQPKSIKEMQQQQFSHHPELAGMGYGFFESFENGQRLIWHDGSTGGFKSDLVLFPDAKMGYFVATNSRRGGQLTHALREQFVDYLFPTENPAETTVETAPLELAPTASPLQRFIGTYQHNRYSRNTLEKVEKLVDNKLAVTANQDQLIVWGQDFVEIAPLLFQNKDTGKKIAFRADANGAITHLFDGPFALEKTVWHQQSWFQFGLLGFCLVIFAVTLGWALICSFSVRRHRSYEGLFVKRALWFSAGVSLFHIGLATSLFTILSSDAVGQAMRSHVPPLVLSLLVGGLVSAVLAGISVILALWIWVRKDASYMQRIHYSMIAAASAALVWFLNYWNLLGFRYPS